MIERTTDVAEWIEAAPYLKADALWEAAAVADRGEGGGCDDRECEDWSAWLRARAEQM